MMYSGIPLPAAVVIPPDRRLWPAIPATFMPVRDAARLRM